MLWFLWACRTNSICSAPEVWKEALETRLHLPCSEIKPAELKKLNLSNWSSPLTDETILEEFYNLRELKLSDTQLTDISFVEKMPKLEVLHIDHSSVSDLSPLANISSLREIWLDYSPVVDLQPLSKHKELSILTLRESKIYDLSPLSSLVHLSVLDISNTAVFDLTPLAKIQKIEAISIRNTQISDIEPLKKHTTLKMLDMRETRVREVSSLQNLTQLQALDCGQNRIIEFSTLPTSLQEFRADNNPISKTGCTHLQPVHKAECEKNLLSEQDPFMKSCLLRENASFAQKTTYDSLFAYTNATTCAQVRQKMTGSLDLRAYPILDVGLFTSLPIQELILDSQWVWPELCPKDSSAFAVFKYCSQHTPQLPSGKLDFLTMCKNPASKELQTTFEVLQQELRMHTCSQLWKNLSTLSSLEISRKNLSDLRPLQFFSNLKALYLDYNQIEDITPLQHLTNLQILWFDDNNITDLSPLKAHKQLLWLGAGDNKISDLSPLTQLVELRRLWLGGNQISDIAALHTLTNMRKLHLAFNAIEDISSLSKMPHLESLYLAENKISDVTSLTEKRNLKLLNAGLDYQESPLEAHQWFLRNNPISQCPKNAPLPVRLACIQR